MKEDLHGGKLEHAAAAAREFKKSIQQFIEKKKLGGEVKIIVFVFMDLPCYQKEYRSIDLKDFLAGFNRTDYLFHLILTSEIEGCSSAKVQGKFPLLCICVLTLRLIRGFLRNVYASYGRYPLQTYCVWRPQVIQ